MDLFCYVVDSSSLLHRRYSHLRKTQLHIAVHAFADEVEATKFSESDVGGGVKVAAAAVEFGPLMDLRRKGAGAAYVFWSHGCSKRSVAGL